MMLESLKVLIRAIFNDEKTAREILNEAGAQITSRSPYVVKVLYYQSAAFLANQMYEYDKAMEFLNLARLVYERLSDSPSLANVWLDCSAVLTNQRKWKEAQAAIDKARRLLKNAHHTQYHAHLIAREGVLHLHLSNWGLALEYLLEADKCLVDLKGEADLKDHHIHTLVLSSLGGLYAHRNDRIKSVDAYRRVLPIVEEHHLWPRLSWHYLNAARASLALDNPRDAQEYLLKSLETASPSDTEVRASVYTNLGAIALLNDDMERASIYFHEGAALFANPEKPSDFENLAKAEWWHAELCKSLNDTAGREEYLLNSFESGSKGADLFQQRRTSLALSGLYGDADLILPALEWQKRATELTEQYYKHLLQTERQELDARYELERIRQEAQMARLRVVGLQSRALRAQMNPHFLFNALNAIQGFITSGRGIEAATYLARFAKFMRQTLEYSDLEEVPLDEEISFIEKYLEINKKLRFRDKLEYVVHPPVLEDAGELMIPAMIIQPFVENCIEHGLRPKQSGFLSIEFKLTEDEKSLICIIEDDGVGINKGKEKQLSHNSEHQTHRSRGMEITRERLGLLHNNPHGQFVIMTDRSEIPPYDKTGTRVEVILPLLNEG